ncbi:hypothetical protein SSS_09802, partial [Sarcoptes scabiei]
DPTVFWIPFRFSFDWRISFLSNNKKIMPDSSQTNTKIIDEIFDIKNVRIRMISSKLVDLLWFGSVNRQIRKLINVVGIYSLVVVIAAVVRLQTVSVIVIG